MSGVNKVIIVGRLGSDPEVKTITSGQTVCRLSVATSENWTDRDGQKQERTEWHRIVVWGKVAEICGLVKEATSTPSFVKVVVDYNSKRPATYNAIAGADGKFCQVVVSYYGTAQASLF